MSESKRVAVIGDAGMVRSDAGLIVPEHVIEKQRQRWTWEEWKKVDRGIKELAKGGHNPKAGKILALLACTKCGKRLTAKLTDRGFEMECECTIHEVTRR